ncbi:MAG: peptidase S41 [Acidobacteria bacterium]|nr:peptidase S41 [Acidobacteriota bacterium]
MSTFRSSSVIAMAALVAALAVPLASRPANAAARPNGGLIRTPDVSATHIVFAYAEDLWLVSRDGGTATPLASPRGPEYFPRFSRDGQTIVFHGNYDGDEDLYTISVAGGAPRRVTHHPAAEYPCDWTPDGRLLFATNGLAMMPRVTELWTVAPEGGLPSKLPVPYGFCGTMSDDGRWLIYTPHTIDNRTWKRYRGGMATDIWMFDLKAKSSRRITEWEGIDTQPMWAGAKVYYLSDAGPEHRVNVWSFDPASGRREQVTRFRDFDTKHASMGPGPKGQGEIVLQNGSRLYLLDLAGGDPREVAVSIPGAAPTIRPRPVDAAAFITDYAISPEGKRVAVEARGDIWTLPAENGSPRNLTRTSATAERFPSWSHDGKHLAYFSDATGEYELYVRQSDGKGEVRQVTKDGAVFRFAPTWSPDDKRIAFGDKTGAIFVHDLDAKTTTRVDANPFAGLQPFVALSWSPDSRYIAYDRAGDKSFQSSIFIYDVIEKKARQVTSGMFSDSDPVFDRKGDFLFFVTSRHFRPIYGELDTTWVYAGSQVISAVPLRADVKNPFAPTSDEETWDDAKKDGDKKDGDEKAGAEKKDADNKDADKKDGDKKEKEAPKPVVITFEGFESRAMMIPIKPGVFGRVAVNDKGHLVYSRGTLRGVEGEPEIFLFDMEDKKKEEKSLVKGTGSFELSADGALLLYVKDGKAAIRKAAPGDEPKVVPTGGMITHIEPRQEWRQIFDDTWRIMRDYFYDPTMHGVDWKAQRAHYAAMIDECVTREDVAFVIRELISELNVGHAYYRPGPTDEGPRLGVGLLGADYALENGAYRITRIYGGGDYDMDARAPLGIPGVDVKEGEYLLAVNGVPVDTKKDPWAAFVGAVGRAVTITVSKKPVMDADARDVVIEPVESEADLRYRAWIERNRRYVAEKTQGRVGYIHVPDTGVNGQTELVRQFFGQTHLAGLVIDERWNGGGQIPTRFIELLNRPMTNLWARRDGRDWVWPPDAHHGPKVMLINGLSGSGGDAFPAYFRQAGLGKLIGTRTWGGLVGISGGPDLIDGAAITAPSFAFYEKDGTWGIEGHGVDPDLEVIDDPAQMQGGADPQLDAAIAELLRELERNPPRIPARPAYPDRRGMGIPDKDK